MADASRRDTVPRTLAKLAGVIVVTGVLVAGVLLPVVGGAGLVGKSQADRFLTADCNLNDTSPTAKTTIYASDGRTVIAQLFSQNRVAVTLDQIPTFMQKALIDTEDRRFYQHHGVDVQGLARAAVSNGGGSSTQGGSTLTMQYVKQLRYYNADTDAQRQAAIAVDVNRKIEDAKCALDLEKRESKAQILQNYFNIAFFGQNSYSVQVAAQTYFATDVSKLTLPQAALIVGLVQSPTEYNPFVHPEAALARRNIVLQNMVTNHDLSPADAATAVATPVGLAATSPPAVQEGCAFSNPAIVNAGFFCDYVVDEWLPAHGFPTGKLTKGGYDVVTTLDAGLQTQGEQAVMSDPKAFEVNPNSPRGATNSPLTLIMPSVDPKTGNVTTMISSRRYGIDQNDPQVTANPIFTQAAAGAGSTFKYFSVVTALTAGMPIQAQLTAGAPYSTKNCPKDNGKTYTAVNAGNYAPTLTMDKAFYESSNTFFVGLEDMVFGCYTKPISDTALNLGMHALTTTAPPVNEKEATFTLGQHPTSPLELTEAYATAANDGVYCPSNAVLSITTTAGVDVPVQRAGCEQKMDPQVARTITTSLVQDTKVSGGTATSQFRSWYSAGGSPVASKTGTNNATDPNTGDDNGKNSALWFVGMTPGMVSGAAIINLSSPTRTLKGVPGVSDGVSQSDSFGATAGYYWLKAYGPTLAAQQWTWPAPGDVPGTTVPNVTGQTPAAATAALQAAGFKANILSYPCGSNQRTGTLIGYSPTKANPGATVTACVSNGKTPTGYATTGGTAPVPPRSSTTVRPPSGPVTAPPPAR